MSTPIVIIRGGAFQMGVGDAEVIDMDDFDCDSIDFKAEKIYRLTAAMESNNMLDDDTKREAIMQKLDELMDSLIDLAAGVVWK
jgi:hypothetical protein